MFLRWVFSLLIYIFVATINITLRADGFLSLYAYTVLSLGLAAFFGVLIIIKARINRENRLSDANKSLSSFSVLLSTVFKNEGTTVIKTAGHYTGFKNKIRIVFYDDHSDDGSFEELKKIEKANRDLFTVKKLIKSKKILHPKGMGFEDMIKNHKSDYYLIIDADTIIDEESLKKALNMMKKNDIKVLHFTRRNDLSDDLANNIGDTEEMFSTVNKVIGIFPWYFNGSGFIMKSEVAEKMIYDDYSPSDDSQIGFFLRKNNIKVFDTLTLFAHEKAPGTVMKLLKQHSSWTKGGIHHYLEKERFTIFPLAFISAYFIFAVLNPLGLYNIFVPLTFIFIWSIDFFSNLLLAKRSFFKSLRNAVLHTLSLFYKGMIIVPCHIILFPFKRHTFWFSRTNY